MKEIQITVFCLIILLMAGTLTASHPSLITDNGALPVLTRPERADSAHGFDVSKYEIFLTVNDQTQSLNGSVKAHVTAGETLAGIDYNLIGLTVTQAKVDDVVTTFTHQNGILHINLNAVPGQDLITEVTYSGTPQHSPAPYNLGVIWGGTTVFTLSDPDASRYWWPCYDHPWDKAIMDLHITMRDDWLVACNGIRESMVDNGNGTKTHNWLGSNPMSPYLACFTAGPYVEINQTLGTVPIQNFVLQSQYNNALIDFSTLPSIIQFYESQYGPYPFEKYGNAVVSMTTYGAMEHQTMTTLGNQFITGNHSGEFTIAHELAHSWFGNCLTPLTFKDVWLSEGFATYSEFLWSHHRDGWNAACNYMENSFHQYYINFENANSGLPNIIYDPPFNYYFYPQSYEKAASVLHMLRLKIGNADFFQLLQNWFTNYHNGNVITAEFQAMAEQISGMDLEQFFQQWIYHRGIPSVEYTVMVSEDLGRVKINAKSTCNDNTQFYLDIPVALAATPSDSIVVHASPNGYVNDFPFNTNLNLSTFTWDPHHWVLARQHTTNQMQMTQCLSSNNLVQLGWDDFSNFVPLIGYFVWRSPAQQTNWTLLNNTPVTSLSYFDTEVENGISYQYRVTALDDSGYQSLPSNVMTATPIAFPFDCGMLVVDETRDGTGTILSPTDAMVDDFYAAALNQMAYTNWDIASSGNPNLAMLSHYPLVFWHSDDFSQIQVGTCLETLSSYLLGGGKLVISGWKTPSAFTTTFCNTWFPDVELVYDNSAVLISAQSDTYPELIPDPDKLTGVWNGMLPMVYTFQNSTNNLYTANMTPDAEGYGLPIAVRFDDTGTLVMFGFPLYYMLPTGVGNMLQQLLPSLLPAVANPEDNLPSPELRLSCYPNPFTGYISIRLPGKFTRGSALKIYNVKGQLVAVPEPGKTKGNDNTVVWDGNDIYGNRLSPGVYILRYTDGKVCESVKAVLLN